MKIPLTSLTFTLACCSSIYAEESKAPVLKLEQGWDDIESVDYSHLFIQLPDIKAEDNGMPALAKIQQELADKYKYHELFSNNKELTEKQLFEAKKKVFEAILPRYKEIDAAITKPHIYEKSGFTISSSLPNTIGMIYLHRYLSLRTIMCVRQGKKEEALQSFKKEIEFANKLRAHCYHLVHMLVSEAIEWSIIESADEMLRMAEDDDEIRELVIKSLRRDIPHRANMKRAMQGEFLMAFNTINSLVMGELNFDSVKNMDEELPAVTFWDAVCQPKSVGSVRYRKQLAGRQVMGLMMQPNKTVKFSHDAFLRQCKMLTLKPYELIDYEESNEVLEEVKMMKRGLFKKPTSNIMGQALLAISSPIIDRQIIKMYVTPVGAELVVLRDALRRYKKDHGDFPETLNMLVPKYINEISVDPFSKQKKTLQYDKKKALIWSVGTDGIDSFRNLQDSYERESPVKGVQQQLQPHLSLN